MLDVPSMPSTALREQANVERMAKTPRLEWNTGTCTDHVPPAIDEWLKAQGLNVFGDPIESVYLGGTPLFDEMTGTRRSRLGYILERHPFLRRLLPGAEGSYPVPPHLSPRPEWPRCNGPRHGRPGSGITEFMRIIEEIRAEIRKVLEALLRSGDTKRGKKRLLNRLEVLQKILLALYMKLGGQDRSSNGAALFDTGGTPAAPSPQSAVVAPIGESAPAAPMTTAT